MQPMAAISKGPPRNYRSVIDVVEEVRTVSGYGWECITIVSRDAGNTGAAGAVAPVAFFFRNVVGAPRVHYGCTLHNVTKLL